MRGILINCLLMTPRDLNTIYQYCNEVTLHVNRHLLESAMNFFSNLSVLSGVGSGDFIATYFKENLPDKTITPRDKLKLKKALGESNGTTSFFTIPCGLSEKEFSDFKKAYESTSSTSIVLKCKTAEIPDSVDISRISKHPTDEGYSEVTLTPLQCKFVEMVSENFAPQNKGKFRINDFVELIEVIDRRLTRKKIDTLFGLRLGNILTYQSVQPILNRIIRSESNLKTNLTEIEILENRYLNADVNKREEYKRMLSEIAVKISNKKVFEHLKIDLASVSTETGDLVMDDVLDFVLKCELGDKYDCEFPEEYTARIEAGDSIDTVWRNHFKNMVMYYIALKFFENSTFCFVDSNNTYSIEKRLSIDLLESETELNCLVALKELSELGLKGLSLNMNYEVKAINDVWSTNQSQSEFLNSEFNLMNSTELRTNANIQFICKSLKPLIINELGFLANRG